MKNLFVLLTRVVKLKESVETVKFFLKNKKIIMLRIILLR